MLRLTSLAIICSALSAGAHADVRDTDRERVLGLPQPRPALALPKGDWTIQREQRRDGGTAVYYHLASDKTKLNFSVYIDKTTACSDADGCLKAALENKSYKEAKEMSVSSSGPFKVAAFFLDQPAGLPIQQAHVLASAYVEGVWFDIHISLAGKERPELAPLLELLKTVELR